MIKNFTVIGNMLFCHIKLNNIAFNPDDNIAEVPPALYDRIMQNGIYGSLVRERSNQYNLNDSRPRSVYIDEDNGKYYIKTPEEILGPYLF